MQNDYLLILHLGFPLISCLFGVFFNSVHENLLQITGGKAQILSVEFTSLTATSKHI